MVAFFIFLRYHGYTVNTFYCMAVIKIKHADNKKCNTEGKNTPSIINRFVNI